MLVIVSDLHFTDGTSGKTIREEAFRTFRQRLGDLAYDASWYLRQTGGNGKTTRAYKPIEELDIVLLGDIIDVIRSNRWTNSRSTIRPWNYDGSAAKTKQLVAKVSSITSAILDHNKPSMQVLASLSDPGTITLPPAKNDRPLSTVGWAPDSPHRLPVTVRLHYMVGNHDWFYHIDSADMTPIRRRIKKTMGLYNDATKPFPHEPDESPELAEILKEHRVCARHGDIYDPFNFDGHRDCASLGDAIVIELLNQFPVAVEQEMKTKLKGLPPQVVDGLREIDNVRPLFLVPSWINGMLKRLCTDRKQAKQVKEVWNALVSKFLKIPYVKSRDTWNPWDNVDKLQTALILSTGAPLPTVSRILQWYNKNSWRKSDSYVEHALTENNFKNRTARYVVYGHTHLPELTPLDVSYTQDGELNQVYFNSGTWRRVHKLAQLQTKDEEFIPHDVTTYLAFFKDHERCGRLFETWTGAVGIGPA